MTARTHDMAALAALLSVAAYSPPEKISVATCLLCLVANNIGALIPDLDSASNRLWDMLPAGDYLAKVFRKIFWKHRTLSHSFFGFVLVYAVLDWLLPYIFNAVTVDYQLVLISTMIGYVSHLLTDAMTKEGVPLLFPIDLNIGLPPFEFLRMKTGSWVEKFLVYPGLLVYVFILVIYFQERFVLLFQAIT